MRKFSTYNGLYLGRHSNINSLPTNNSDNGTASSFTTIPLGNANNDILSDNQLDLNVNSNEPNLGDNYATTPPTQLSKKAVKYLRTLAFHDAIVKEIQDKNAPKI